MLSLDWLAQWPSESMANCDAEWLLAEVLVEWSAEWLHEVLIEWLAEWVLEVLAEWSAELRAEYSIE